MQVPIRRVTGAGLGAAPTLRRPRADASLVVAALAQGILALALVAAAQAGRVLLPAAAATFAVGLWWCSNTIAHVQIHTPLFRARRWNRAFGLYLTVLTGVPQSLWRARHLWHHAGEPRDRRPRLPAPLLAIECLLVAGVIAALLLLAPVAFFGAWLPGFLLGLGLCQLHGHFEHAGAPLTTDAGVSCYRPLYNRLWFNDGYHAEHHRWPGLHWSELPARRLARARASAWPPLLRWLDPAGARLNRQASRALDRLERLALWSPAISRFVLDRHEQALRALLDRLEGRPIARAAIVGGGLFPRTALLLRQLLPDCELVVIEADPRHIARAQAYLADAPPSEPDPSASALRFIHASFDPDRLHALPWGTDPFDLIIVPLGYRGDRDRLYAQPPAPVMLIHDWLWRRRGQDGVRVSRVLLKRLNLVCPGD